MTYAREMPRQLSDAGDALNLFEAFACCGHDLVTSANALYTARTAGDGPTESAIVTARLAAERVLAKISQYETALAAADPEMIAPGA